MLSFKFDIAQSFPETAIKRRNIFERNAVREIQVHVQYSSRPEIQVQMNDRAEARRQGLALGNNRAELLLQALQRNIGTITVAKCGQWFRFMQTYLPRCINNEAIEG